MGRAARASGHDGMDQGGPVDPRTRQRIREAETRVGHPAEGSSYISREDLAVIIDDLRHRRRPAILEDSEALSG